MFVSSFLLFFVWLLLFFIIIIIFFYLPWRPTTGHPSSHREHRRICKYVLVNNGLVKYKYSNVNKQSCSQHLKSGLVLNRYKFHRPSVCSFTSCEFFVAGSGQFSSVLVHLLCPLHNTFQVTSASNDNQTNPLNIREGQPYP